MMSLLYTKDIVSLPLMAIQIYIKARNNGCNVIYDTLATSLVTFVATKQNLEFQLIIRKNLMLEGVCHPHSTYSYYITTCTLGIL